MHPRARRSSFRALVVAGLVLAGCTSNTSESGPVITDPSPDVESAEDTTTTTALPEIELVTIPALGQLTIVDAEAGSTIIAATVDGNELARDEVETNGTALLRELPAGPVAIRIEQDGAEIATSAPVEIPDSAPPPQDFYNQASIQPGYQYLTMRDGTTLSAYVTLPAGQSIADGPFPTLVEYSGYAPSDPTATDPARLTLPLLGYALVQVNVRGTGCSGGSYDGFAVIERLDGYDVIETVAAQPWSAGVGMWGISYPGIMQLHVAAAQPPNLAAIAPLSVIGSVDDILFPGGIFNNGFGQAWTERVTGSAQASGQGWSSDRIDAGDDTCEQNQELRVHNPNLVDTALAAPFSTEMSRRRSPESFVDQIEVPTFLAGAWQDEQTGGGFPILLDRFTAAPVLRANLYNGLHIDPLGPDTLVPLLEFYDLYVARRTPRVNPLVELVVSAGTASFFGEALVLSRSPLAGLDYEEALTTYEAQPPITVLYEAGAANPNLPVANFTASFAEWPLPLEGVRFQLDAELSDSPAREIDGSLATVPIDEVSIIDKLRTDETVVSFVSEPAEGGTTTADDTSVIWGPQPEWDWPLAAADAAARFSSEPFDSTTVLTGSAAANLRVRLPDGEPDADLEATLSAVDPEGNETYLQSGWLRLSRRALRSDATSFAPRISNTQDDIAPVRVAEIVAADIWILPFAHVLRPGDRLVLTIDTPGASKPEWTFDTFDTPIRVEILSGSSLLVPVVPGELFPATVAEDAPACGTLRAQPCRAG